MTDRELLELAAKAAGMQHKWAPVLGGMYHIIDAGRIDGPWNPLVDDATALRLAVKLDIAFMRYAEKASATTNAGQQLCEWLNDDPYAATRRAIVRAAAEIGRAL